MEGTRSFAPWGLRHSMYDVDHVHRAVVRYQSVDTLFRLQTTSEGNTPLGGDLFLPAVSAESNNFSMLAVNASRNDFIPLSAQKEKLVDPFSALEELAHKQGDGATCKAPPLKTGHVGSKYHGDQQGLRVQKSLFHESVQIVVPTLLRARTLYLAHHPANVEHPRPW